MTDARRELARLRRLLESLGHKGVLARGYAVVRSDGAVLTDAAGVKTGQALELEFRDGRVVAVAGKGERTKKAAPKKPGQGVLDL